jgi:hypothetical protein
MAAKGARRAEADFRGWEPSMSDKIHGPSIVCLVQWLLIKNGFTEDQVDAIIDKLRSELSGFTAKKEDSDEVRLALSQRLARYITRLELGDGVSQNIF